MNAPLAFVFTLTIVLLCVAGLAWCFAKPPSKSCPMPPPGPIPPPGLQQGQIPLPTSPRWNKEQYNLEMIRFSRAADIAGIYVAVSAGQAEFERGNVIPNPLGAPTSGILYRDWYHEEVIALKLYLSDVSNFFRYKFWIGPSGIGKSVLQTIVGGEFALRGLGVVATRQGAFVPLAGILFVENPGRAQAQAWLMTRSPAEPDGPANSICFRRATSPARTLDSMRLEFEESVVIARDGTVTRDGLSKSCVVVDPTFLRIVDGLEEELKAVPIGPLLALNSLGNLSAHYRGTKDERFERMFVAPIPTPEEFTKIMGAARSRSSREREYIETTRARFGRRPRLCLNPGLQADAMVGAKRAAEFFVDRLGSTSCEEALYLLLANPGVQSHQALLVATGEDIPAPDARRQLVKAWFASEEMADLVFHAMRSCRHSDYADLRALVSQMHQDVGLVDEFVFHYFVRGEGVRATAGGRDWPVCGPLGCGGFAGDMAGAPGVVTDSREDVTDSLRFVADSRGLTAGEQARIAAAAVESLREAACVITERVAEEFCAALRAQRREVTVSARQKALSTAELGAVYEELEKVADGVVVSRAGEARQRVQNVPLAGSVESIVLRISEEALRISEGALLEIGEKVTHLLSDLVRDPGSPEDRGRRAINKVFERMAMRRLIPTPAFAAAPSLGEKLGVMFRAERVLLFSVNLTRDSPASAVLEVFEERTGASRRQMRAGDGTALTGHALCEALLEGTKSLLLVPSQLEMCDKMAFPMLDSILVTCDGFRPLHLARKRGHPCNASNVLIWGLFHLLRGALPSFGLVITAERGGAAPDFRELGAAIEHFRVDLAETPFDDEVVRGVLRQFVEPGERGYQPARTAGAWRCAGGCPCFAGRGVRTEEMNDPGGR